VKKYLHAFAVWIIFGVVANLNGIFRNWVVSPRLGDYAGHVISSVILVCLIFIITFLFIKRSKNAYSNLDLILMGVFWLLLTIAFEFVFGHYVIGHPWAKLVADYNILRGRLWIFIPLTTLIAPYISGRLLSK